MATLQKLRNAGPLLLIFVGIALFAFIAGDALRIFQSPQGAQAVGSINGEEISAAEFQELYEEYSNVLQFMRNGAPLSDEEQSNLKDQVWNEYLQNKVIQEEAQKIGLTVSDAELLAIISEGSLPILQQSPFSPEGKFDFDFLNQFLAEYENNKNDFAYVQQNKPFYDYWCFIEKTIKNDLLAAKYQALVVNSFISNPVVAENSFNSSNVTYNAEIKVLPYSAIADSTINVSDSEVKAAYEEKKQLFKQLVESRNIKYVSYKVVPSEQDREALRAEIAEQVNTLAQGSDYANIVRAASSEVPYSQLAWAKSRFPEEVRLRLDSVKVDEVEGPIYNASDNSFTVFKNLGKVTLPDSVLYRVLPVNDKALADSLLNVLKNNGNFKEISTKYAQTKNDSLWLTLAMYEGAPIQGDDATFISTLLNAKKGEYNIMSLTNGAIVIYQVIATKNPVEKYNAAVVKRTVEFSSETYAAAYNNFSQFVASCKTIEDLEKNVEQYDGFRVLTANNLYNRSHNIANIKDTRKAIRWIFSEAEVGEVSPLYECGDNNTLLVVALSDINEKGFTPLDKMSVYVRSEAIKNKKAEKIMNDIKGKSFDELANVAGVKSDVAERISFVSPTFVKSISANEPAISAVVTKMKAGEVSAPIKGEKGVYVVKLLAVNKGGREFNPEAEQTTLKSSASTFITNSFFNRYTGDSQFFNELFQKGNVEDNRYLYF
ncbi:MAG: SurA N-terminal domain-containing protein [Bacteroidaceae bacterium]|nr:SurA N-terminal domain-containing protein [Bacteroidaceae bacterium]